MHFLKKIDIRAGLSSAAAAATVGVLEEAPKLEDYTEDMWSKVKVNQTIMGIRLEVNQEYR